MLCENFYLKYNGMIESCLKVQKLKNKETLIQELRK